MQSRPGVAVHRTSSMARLSAKKIGLDIPQPKGAPVVEQEAGDLT
jgi:hypothetical protein